MSGTRFTDIITNEHFRQIAATLHVPFVSLGWRRAHPKVPFWLLWDALAKAVAKEWGSGQRDVVIGAFVDLQVAVTEADPRLALYEDDVAWLMEQLAGDDAPVTFTMLLAYISARHELMTPVQAAEATGTSESYWRNAAAAGDIPGAVKRGKQWLVPAIMVRRRFPDAHDLDLDEAPLTEEDLALDRQNKKPGPTVQDREPGS